MDIAKKVELLKQPKVVRKPVEETYNPKSEQVILSGSVNSPQNNFCFIPVDIDVEED